MNNTDAAYLAGLVDGEGHIGIRWNKGVSGWLLAPGLSVGSSDLPVLQWCYSVTGVGRVRYTLNQSPLSHKEQYKWQD